MALIDYSTTPANNNAAPPDGAPEGMAAASVNNTMRQIMADVKGGVGITVNTTALMTAMTVAKLSDNNVISVTNYATDGDEGGGLFFYDSSSVATANGGTIFAPDSGAGRFIRVDQDKLTFDMFGAVGDGVADDAAAWQAAIDSITQGVISGVPGKTYGIGAAGVTLTSQSDICLNLTGSVVKLLAVTTPTITGFGAVGILFDTCTNCGIVGGEFDGDSKAVNFIGFDTCTDCYNLTSEVHTSGVLGQIISSGSTRLTIEGNEAHSGIGTSRGIWLGNTNAAALETDIRVNDNIARNNPATGIVITSNGGVVQGNRCITNEGSGLICSGANGFTTSNVTVSGNYLKDNLFHGFQSDVVFSTDADLTNGLVIADNICIDNNRGTGSGIFMVNSLRCIVKGNTCTNNGNSGIQGDGRTRKITISGNQCSDTRVGGARTQINGIRLQASSASTFGAVVSGNTCDNNTTEGILLRSDTGFNYTDVTITGNICTDSNRGIFVNPAAGTTISRVVIDGNICDGNSTFDMRIDNDDVVLGNNKYGAQQGYNNLTFTDLDTTPSVAGRPRFREANTGATTITDFDDGAEGQEMYVVFTTNNTTLTHADGKLELKGLVSVTPGATSNADIMGFTFQFNFWIETYRNF